MLYLYKPLCLVMKGRAWLVYSCIMWSWSASTCSATDVPANSFALSSGVHSNGGDKLSSFGTISKYGLQ